MKLLLIDDNQALVKELTACLDSDWQVTSANSGHEGLKLARNDKYDAIILRVRLPDLKGQDICRRLRKGRVASPIMVLSAISEPNTKVSMLQAGADDYLTKPYDPNELKARLLALLRRGHLGGESGSLQVADLVLNPLQRQVQRGGKKITLRRKEFDILEYLMRNRDRVVSRSMIINNVWTNDCNAWNNTVDVHIKRLRDKVDQPFKQCLIHTMYGVGYIIKEPGS